MLDLLERADLKALQDIASDATDWCTFICDTQGRFAVVPVGPGEVLGVLRSSARFSALMRTILDNLTAPQPQPNGAADCFEASPIRVGTTCIGALIAGPVLDDASPDTQLRRLASALELNPHQVSTLRNWSATLSHSRHTLPRQSVATTARLASTLAEKSYRLHHREIELGIVHELSQLLAGTQDLQLVLDTVSRHTCQAMNLKASSIRLLDEDTNELRIKSVHNLSDDYLNKGAVLLRENPIDRAAFAGEAVYVEDAATDPRIRFPEQAAREGIVSGLSVGLTYRGKTIGVMRVYAAHKYLFSTAEIALLRSIASQATSAIINHRLHIEALQADRYQKQLEYAGSIQRRMIPASTPEHAKISFACVYEPSSQVGGDFFDFHARAGFQEIGFCIADVVGKGIPAALMMASLRTACRLFAYSVMEITEIMTMVNLHMTRETLVGEFATMFYGTFSENGRKLTYCCAGHDPPLHYRAGKITELKTGDFVIGVEPNESYSKKSIGLKKGDVIIFYTDGIVDASNFSGASFGRERLVQALKKYADAPASQIAQNILWDVRRFVGLADQADDITLVAAEIR